MFLSKLCCFPKLLVTLCGARLLFDFGSNMMLGSIYIRRWWVGFTTTVAAFVTSTGPLLGSRKFIGWCLCRQLTHFVVRIVRATASSCSRWTGCAVGLWVLLCWCEAVLATRRELRSRVDTSAANANLLWEGCNTEQLWRGDVLNAGILSGELSFCLSFRCLMLAALGGFTIAVDAGCGEDSMGMWKICSVSLILLYA